MNSPSPTPKSTTRYEIVHRADGRYHVNTLRLDSSGSWAGGRCHYDYFTTVMAAYAEIARQKTGISDGPFRIGRDMVVYAEEVVA